MSQYSAITGGRKKQYSPYLAEIMAGVSNLGAKKSISDEEKYRKDFLGLQQQNLGLAKRTQTENAALNAEAQEHAEDQANLSTGVSAVGTGVSGYLGLKGLTAQKEALEGVGTTAASATPTATPALGLSTPATKPLASLTQADITASGGFETALNLPKPSVPSFEALTAGGTSGLSGITPAAMEASGGYSMAMTPAAEQLGAGNLGAVTATGAGATGLGAGLGGATVAGGAPGAAGAGLTSAGTAGVSAGWGAIAALPMMYGMYAHPKGNPNQSQSVQQQHNAQGLFVDPDGQVYDLNSRVGALANQSYWDHVKEVTAPGWNATAPDRSVSELAPASSTQKPVSRADKELALAGSLIGNSAL